jgi:hypothetical protein
MVITRPWVGYTQITTIYIVTMTQSNSEEENLEGWTFLQFCDPAERTKASNIVQRRAWVLQETELSPRRIELVLS